MFCFLCIFFGDFNSELTTTHSRCGYQFYSYRYPKIRFLCRATIVSFSCVFSSISRKLHAARVPERPLFYTVFILRAYDCNFIRLGEQHYASRKYIIPNCLTHRLHSFMAPTALRKKQSSPTYYSNIVSIRHRWLHYLWHPSNQMGGRNSPECIFR